MSGARGQYLAALEPGAALSADQTKAVRVVRVPDAEELPFQRFPRDQGDLVAVSKTQHKGERVHMALEQPPEGQAAPADLLQRFVQRGSGQRCASELLRQRGREETGFVKGGHVLGRIGAVRVAGCGPRERRLGDFTGDASDRLRVRAIVRETIWPPRRRTSS